ncbi:hypothetical protein K470DRAFT_259611 [Piedraia hortae CBS 480.64]|uniref:Uncharacterized protein n=1 Tax=Piedraia hortae CBS 480.64 TaxID=1314780 RepID=A0A6A7BTM8_9PEZI|nr:hypothetical protein K470DRAFT_259611 [Piedraia hortae CBS 480.64]
MGYVWPAASPVIWPVTTTALITRSGCPLTSRLPANKATVAENQCREKNGQVHRTETQNMPTNRPAQQYPNMTTAHNPQYYYLVPPHPNYQPAQNWIPMHNTPQLRAIAPTGFVEVASETSESADAPSTNDANVGPAEKEQPLLLERTPEGEITP